MEQSEQWEIAQNAIKEVAMSGVLQSSDDVVEAIRIAITQLAVADGADLGPAARIGNNVADTIDNDFVVYLAIFSNWIKQR